MFKEEFKSIFLSTKGSISSKRVCGVIGWLVCVGIVIYCTIKAVLAPSFADSVLFSTVALLGVDSVTGIWKHNSKNDNKAHEDLRF